MRSLTLACAWLSVWALAGAAPAAEAELQGGNRQVRYEGAVFTVDGDIITAIDGVDIESMDDLIIYLAGTSVDQEVELTILRDGVQQTVNVVLEERPTS